MQSTTVDPSILINKSIQISGKIVKGVFRPVVNRSPNLGTVKAKHHPEK